MAKIVLEVLEKTKTARQGMQLLNAEVKTLSQTLSSIKVNKNLTTQINALTKHYKTVADAHAKIIANKNKEAIADEKLRLAEAKTATQIAKTNTEISKQSNLNARTEKTTYSLAQAKERATQATQKQTAATKANTIVNNNNTQSIGSMTVNIFKWQLAMTSVMKPLRLLQDAWASLGETLVSTEDKVVALQRVVGDIANANELYDLAAKYGQTFENVSEAVLNFARRGMSWNESLKATEAALLAINVAELDVGQATDGLGAIMAQFGIQASKLTTVVDMLNKTADKFPVTTSKILAALQRTGSTASTANLSLEETIGLITTLSKATNRSGENIGTALNSILNISQKDSTLETFSKLGGNVAQIVEQYRGGGTSILEVLRAVSIEVQNLNTNQIFDSEAFNALNEDLKESMGEDFEMLSEIYGTAGTYRRNYFIALLNDLDTVKQVENEIFTAQGYSQAENQKYLDTYTAKLNTLKAQWEDIANSEQGLLGLKKVLVDIGSGLLTVMKWTGGLRTALIGIGSALATLFAPKILSGLNKIGTFFKNLSNPLKNFEKATKATTLAQNAQTLATKMQTRADEAALRAETLKLSASASATAIEQAETAAIRQQTLATQAQTRADELATVAAKAKAAAAQTAIGIIGIGITVTSTIIGLFQSAAEKRKQEAEEARRRRDEIIAEWEAVKDEATAFAELNYRYAELNNISNKTTEQEKEFLSVQESIIKALGYKATALKKLTEGTEEYRTKVEELTQEQIKGYAQQAQAASNAAGINLFEDVFRESIRSGMLAREAGASLGYGYGFDRGNIGTVDYFEDVVQALFDTGSANTDVYNKVYAVYEKLSKSATSYLTAEAQNRAYRYRLSNGSPQTQEDINEIVDSIITATGATERWRDMIEGVVVETLNFKSPKKEFDNWTNDISKVTGAYDDLIKKLEELRDLNKEAYDWEEKKLAVLEAEQALENARNEASVRRFNESTGQWEWQTDEKAIKNAEDNLEKARLNLEEAAYNNIIDQLKEQTATNESILAVIKEVAPLLGKDFENAVNSAITDTTKVDLNKPIISKDGSYDSGGIANGWGFMAKATSQPESVNDPELTRKILTPVSNAEFDRYVKDMGIMFETARQYSQRPIIERVGGNTDNRVDNSGQITMNGVTIGSDRRGNSLNELLTLANIVPNN